MSIFDSVIGRSTSRAPAVQYLPFGMAVDQIGLNRRFSSPSLSVQGGQFTGSQAFNPGLLGAQSDFLSQAGGIRGNLQGLRNEFTGNQNAFINARVNPLRQSVASQRGTLQRDFGRRGVMGSIANREMTGFEFDANRALGDATSLATADALSARQSILQQEQGLAEREFATKFGVNQEMFSRELQGLGLGIESINALLSLAGNLSSNTANAALNKGRLDDLAGAERRGNIGNLINTGADMFSDGKKLWDTGKKAYDFFSNGSAGSQTALGAFSGVGESGLGIAGTGTLGAGSTLGAMSTAPLSSGITGFGSSALAPGGQGMAAMFPSSGGTLATGTAGAAGTGIGTGTGATTAGATTTGAGAAMSGLLSSAGIAGAMIAGMSLLSNLDGGAANKAKTGKLFQQFDSNPAEGYKWLDNIITDKMWTGETESNISRAINPAIDAGVITAEYPTLHSSDSTVNLWGMDPAAPTTDAYGIAKASVLPPKAIAQAYGLSPQETSQYESLVEDLRKVRDAHKSDPGGFVSTFDRRRASKALPQAEAALNQFIQSSMTEDRKRQSAQAMYQKLRSAGYQGDLGKLESYIGVK